MARTGIDLLKALKTSSKVKFHPKSDSETFYLAKVSADPDLKAKTVALIALEGPRAKSHPDEAFVCHMDRLKGVQGRQPGFSPKKSESPAAESPAPAKNKGAGESAKAAKKQEESPAEFDIDSAKKEMLDLIEFLQELADDTAEAKGRLQALHNFMDGLELGEQPQEEEEETVSVKSSGRKGRRSKPMNDEDEEQAA